MKYLNFLLVLILFSVTFSACNNDDDDPQNDTQEWNFDVTFNITDPSTYSFDASGTAMIEIDGDTYTITANYTIGQQSFNDIEITGDIVDGNIDISDKTLVIQWEDQGVTYTETINFSLDVIDASGDTASGSGSVTIAMEPGGILDSGTLDFTATKI